MLVFLAASLLAPQTMVRVTPPEFANAKEPQVAIDADHKVYVVYGQEDSTYLSCSDDKGRTFSKPNLVGTAGKISLGMRRGPRVSSFNGVITITAIYGVQGKGRDGDVVAFTSKDRGLSWSAPVKVNDVSGSAREGLHAMAVAPDGTLACTWLDLRDKGTKLFLSTSKDGGFSWTKNVLAYESPSGTICECCHPSLAFDKSGKLHILFRNSLAGARDMYLASSGDLRAFSPAVKLGQGTWMLQACPMDGGMLAVSPSGKVETTWRRDSTVFAGELGAAELAIAEGRQPWITVGVSGTYLVWQAGKSIMASIPGASLKALSAEGSSPVVTSSPDGKSVYAAWSNRGIEMLRLTP